MTHEIVFKGRKYYYDECYKTDYDLSKKEYRVEICWNKVYDGSTPIYVKLYTYPLFYHTIVLCPAEIYRAGKYKPDYPPGPYVIARCGYHRLIRLEETSMAWHVILAKGKGRVEKLASKVPGTIPIRVEWKYYILWLHEKWYDHVIARDVVNIKTMEVIGWETSVLYRGKLKPGVEYVILYWWLHKFYLPRVKALGSFIYKPPKTPIKDFLKRFKYPRFKTVRTKIVRLHYPQPKPGRIEHLYLRIGLTYRRIREREISPIGESEKEK